MAQSRIVYLAATVPFVLAALLGVAGLVAAESVDLTRTLMLLVLVTAVAGTLLSIVSIKSLLQVLGADPSQLMATASELDQGGSADGERTVGGTIMSRLQALRTFLTESNANAVFTARIRQAVDGANTNIMIADADRTVVYMNHSVMQMLRNAEGEIRKDLPDFSVDTVLNGSIDRFHKDPRHQMQMLDQLRGTHNTEIKLGASSFGLIANPILSPSGERLGTVVEWKDLTLEKQAKTLAVFNTRIRAAIDSAETNIMIADTDRNVVYMNESVAAMLRAAQSQIRKDLPEFDVDKVLHGSIDRFHKDPSHQMNMLDKLKGTHRTQIKLGDNTFGLIASPIFDDDNERVGTVVEWKDLTLEKLADELAVSNTRIRAAIDSAETNIMIADTGRNVVYMNESVGAMLRAAQGEIRKDLPNFDVDKVLNGSIDRFHKDPSMQMKMLDELKSVHRTQIKLGNNTFGLIASPIFNDDGVRLGTVVEWKDRTLELKAEAEALSNTRIRQAIDNSSNNIMIADAERNVVYMNKAVENMLRASERQIRRDLPEFSTDTVLNGSIDRFHKDPSMQMNMLSRLQGTHRAQITLGDDTFGLIANPIFAPDKSRLGTVVEWLNRTDELKTASDVTNLVNSAAAGDFTTRISTEGKDGFFLELSEGLNSLMQTSDAGLQDIARVLGAIAEGDLTERVEADYQGTFLELKDFCNKTTENLTTMIGDIRQASDTIFTASGEIASGNADLSTRTEQQASNLEETASSMEELTSTVRTNTDSAKQANVLAEQASGVATSGGELINQVVITMESINESARKISDIIGVIDGIAFQTNILALNAAVEAARAGEQGRGFAVVASEVRTLAQRSADAAKDIKQLISDSVTKIEGGNQLVNKSGETMGEIVTAIKRVNDIMSEIAAASVEQSSGIEEVNTAVNQMDEMTQQNAALVEQAAAAAESLQSQAEQLQTNLSVFRLDDQDSGRPQAPLIERKPAVRAERAESAAKRPTRSANGSAEAPADKAAARVAAKRKPKVAPKDAESDWESF